MNPSETLQKPPASAARTIFNVTSGNFLEMYDFMVFGYYATAIAKTFFPGDDPFSSLMLTLMTFGAGFLMRPLGAIILGAYIDHHGRRKGLLLTLGLMALGTLTIALVPGYATLGAAAPVLILLGRLLQGFSAGVELGGVSVYLAEVAPKGRKGFFVSWQSGSQQIAVIFAALLGLGLNHLLSHDDVTEWGWRIPFVVGCLIVPFLFYIRRMLEETEAFSQRKHHPAMTEIMRSVASNWALGAGAGRYADGRHYHRDVLYDYRLYAHLRQNGVDDERHPGVYGDAVCRDFEPVLAAGDGRALRSHRASPAAADVYLALDGGLAQLRASGRGGIMALLSLRKL